MVRAFAAEIALQNATDDTGGGGGGRVAISTIHRAKGLEWAHVYVPYFNDGFMPAQYRERDDGCARRHVEGCATRADAHAKCSKGCDKFFDELDRRAGRGTAQERHADEECRLAHVAATRAKDRLVFVSLGLEPRDEDTAPSAEQSPGASRGQDFRPSHFESALVADKARVRVRKILDE